jgi:hypothetical protein
MPQSSPAVGERRPGPRRGNLGVESLRLNQSHGKTSLPSKGREDPLGRSSRRKHVNVSFGIDLPLGSREDLGVEQWCAGPETRS